MAEDEPLVGAEAGLTVTAGRHPSMTLGIMGAEAGIRVRQGPKAPRMGCEAGVYVTTARSGPAPTSRLVRIPKGGPVTWEEP